MVRAWRAYDRFEGRAALRSWLYRIATNVCLDLLSGRQRRARPMDLGPAREPVEASLHTLPEVTWIEPVPDGRVVPEGDPAEVAVARETIRLAFVAALQHLPPRQRAALILRDVLAWSSGEVADLLDTSTTAVNSALQRASSQMSRSALVENTVVEPPQSEQLAIVNRYVAAFVGADMAALSQLLRDDAVLEMPPFLSWFAGRDALLRFFEGIWARRERDAWRMAPMWANRQPAAAAYVGTGDMRGAHSVQVFTVAGSNISRIVAFVDLTLFDTFDLPRAWSPSLDEPVNA
jgi:RNA polymerase sigma-70 factor (ECF subfamily)